MMCKEHTPSTLSHCPHSDEPVFRREGHLHAGGAADGDAGADGTDAAADAAHAHRAPVARHVPQGHRPRVEHTAAARAETGARIVASSAMFVANC